MEHPTTNTVSSGETSLPAQDDVRPASGIEAASTTRTSQRYFMRFNWFHRLLHGVLMTSFLGLAATGMPLRFNHADWALGFSRAIGGFGTIRFFHLFFAVLLTLCFVIHLSYLLYQAVIKRDRSIFWGPSSLVPQLRDFRDLYQQFRWFFGLGPKPQFARFTYWEKFDYWAVFWGMAIIGTSGYVMWFSTFFARFLPGRWFNIALLIHADEALLAVWFVFAIHFFNSHLRPEEFPMDLVILTGRVSEKKLQETRPLEYRRLEEEGKLAGLQTDPPQSFLINFGRLVGFTVIAIGLFLFGLTLWSYLHE